MRGGNADAGVFYATGAARWGNENYGALATRLRENLADLSRVVERTDRLLVKAAQQNDDDYFSFSVGQA